MGLRGWGLLAASAPLSAFVVGSSAIVTEPLFRWGWLPFLLFWGLLCAVAWIFGMRKKDIPLNPFTSIEKGIGLQLTLGTLFAAVVVAWGFIRGTESPATPSLAWDATFHLSAIRWIMQEGTGSLFALGSFAGGGFYPAGWHDFGALLTPISSNPVVAANMMSLAVQAFVWPTGAALLAAVVFQKLKLAPLMALMFAAGSVAFPALVSSYGTLWPFTLAYALVPAVLGLVVLWAKGERFAPKVPLTLALILGTLGVTLIHPQATFVLVLMAGMRVFGLTLELFRKKKDTQKSGIVYLSLVWAAWGAVVFLIAWRAISTTWDVWAERPREGNLWRELWGAVSDSQLSHLGYGNTNPNWLLAACFLVGVGWILWKKHGLWVVGAWFIAAYLFLVSDVAGIPGFGLISYWYYDAVRLGAAIPIVAVPIAAGGASAAIGALWNVTRLSASPKKWVMPAFATFAALLVFIFTGFGQRDTRATDFGLNYHYAGFTGLNGLASPEEVKMIEGLNQKLPKDARILGESTTGMPLVYAITGRDTIFKYHLSPVSPKLSPLLYDFDRLLDDPAVCRLLGESGIEYFYHDPVKYEMNDANMVAFPAMNPGEEVLESMEKIAEGGTATLYKITPCQ